MASSSGTSSQIQNSGSDEKVVDERKRKRMLSNRESARRSRMRKQKHQDDLIAQIDLLSKDNNQILNTINVTTQQCVKVEAHNSVLRAQMMELTHRLQSLNDILNCTAAAAAAEERQGFGGDAFYNGCWSLLGANQQPIMASAHMFDNY